MKVSEAIAKLQVLLREEGDLHIFESEGWSVDNFRAADAEDYGFPDDWNIPDKFVVVHTGK